MPKACPSVHLHPAFEATYNPHDKDQSNYKERLITRLKTGNQAGLKKGGDLEPFYGFPTGHKSTRLLYIKCADCKKEFFKTKCTFCEGASHSMDDAVLFFAGSSHDDAYRDAKNKLHALKNPSFGKGTA